MHAKAAAWLHREKGAATPQRGRGEREGGKQQQQRGESYPCAHLHGRGAQEGAAPHAPRHMGHGHAHHAHEQPQTVLPLSQRNPGMATSSTPPCPFRSTPIWHTAPCVCLRTRGSKATGEKTFCNIVTRIAALVDVHFVDVAALLEELRVLLPLRLWLLLMPCITCCCCRCCFTWSHPESCTANVTGYGYGAHHTV